MRGTVAKKLRKLARSLSQEAGKADQWRKVYRKTKRLYKRHVKGE